MVFGNIGGRLVILVAAETELISELLDMVGMVWMAPMNVHMPWLLSNICELDAGG